MTLKLRDVCLSLGDVAEYLGVCPQTVSRYVREGWFGPAYDDAGRRVRVRVTLEDLNRFIARKFPRRARLATVADWDAWVQQQEGRGAA
jgi:hypothetical protein